MNPAYHAANPFGCWQPSPVLSAGLDTREGGHQGWYGDAGQIAREMWAIVYVLSLATEW